MSQNVFDRDYVSPCAGTYPAPGACPHCGRELVIKGTHPRYCGKPCLSAIAALPLDEREQRRAATPLGECVNCGDANPTAAYGCPHGTSRAGFKRWRAASGRLRFGPDAFEWLAAKLRLEADDDRLADIALKLAEAGRLTVLVAKGRVIGIAKPKATRTSAASAARRSPSRSTSSR